MSQSLQEAEKEGLPRGGGVGIPAVLVEGCRTGGAGSGVETEMLVNSGRNILRNSSRTSVRLNTKETRTFTVTMKVHSHILVHSHEVKVTLKVQYQKGVITRLKGLGHVESA